MGVWVREQGVREVGTGALGSGRTAAGQARGAGVCVEVGLVWVVD